MDQIQLSFGERVKIERNRRGMTQTQLAEAADVSRDVIMRIEQGNDTLMSNAARIAAALGMELAWQPGGPERRVPRAAP